MRTLSFLEHVALCMDIPGNLPWGVLGWGGKTWGRLGAVDLVRVEKGPLFRSNWPLGPCPKTAPISSQELWRLV